MMLLLALLPTHRKKQMSKRTPKSGPVTITKPVAASAMPTVETLPVATAPVAKPATVALRGGPAVTTIKLSGTVYRVTAAHNIAWWAEVTGYLGAETKPVAPLLAKVPATMVGYLIRRGYLIGQ